MSVNGPPLKSRKLFGLSLYSIGFRAECATESGHSDIALTDQGDIQI